MRLAAISLILAAGLAGMAVAQVTSTPGAKAAASRHENFKQLGSAFKGINDQLKTDAPDKGVISANAAKVKLLSSQLPTWFPKGSGPEAGPDIHAKAEVWTDAAGFAAAVKNFQGEAATLQAVSTSGDFDAIRVQVKNTGGACKACHDKYRVPEQH